MAGTKNKSNASNGEDAAADVDADAPVNTTKKQKVAIPSGPIAQTHCARLCTATMEKRTFKAIAWNIAGMRSFAEKHMDTLAVMIAREDPDCVCLEEHKLQTSHVEAMTETLRKRFPEYKTIRFAVSTVKKGYSGVMVMCKASMVGASKGVQTSLDAMFGAKPKTESTATYDGPKLLAINEGLDGGYIDEGRVLTLEYQSFYVVMAYVPNSGQDLKRLDYRIDEWERDMRTHLAHLESKGKPVLYIGDLNVAHLDADIWNVGAPHIKKSAGTTPRERETFGVMLEKNALVDAFRKFHPDATGWFSFWSQRAGNRPVNKGLRLDYTLASKILFDEPKTTSCESKLLVVDAFILDKVMGSDHAPVGIVLALPK